MMDAVIRQATINDLNNLMFLFDAYRVFYDQRENADKARNFLLNRFQNEDSIILVAEVGNKLVGFTQLYPTFSSISCEEDLILNDLFVDANYRKAGIGRELLKAAQGVAIKKNKKGLALSTANDNPAQKLYEAEGWQKDTDFIHYYWLAETERS